jgi:hypothetical protein
MQNSCCNLLLWVAKICSKEFLYLYMRARNQQMCMYDQEEPPGWAFSLVYKMQVSASSCCDKRKANKVGDRDWYIKTSISYIAFYPGMYLLHSCSHWWIDETEVFLSAPIELMAFLRYSFMLVLLWGEKNCAGSIIWQECAEVFIWSNHCHFWNSSTHHVCVCGATVLTTRTSHSLSDRNMINIVY